MNIEKLERVRDLIANAPDVHMPTWVTKTDECGTVGCICGWAALDMGVVREARPGFRSQRLNKDIPCVRDNIDKGLADLKGTYREARSTEAWDFFNFGKGVFELTDGEAGALFNHANWPNNFRTAYDSAKTPEARKAATVARIDHFIQTKGK